ncbi:MAG: nucleotidyl transferase AbiEii/AbiGii toxin family protein [Lewinellaceae bacterium]|nr:nucleotidyl transferase AbiEii/AbiGii toxin family protein [Lewinellaceae bacterium]
MKQLMAMPQLDSFFLVGGTALALQYGHRFSVDLDLFTTEPFDKEALLEVLNQEFSVSVESESKNIYITYINDVKVDFVKVAYPRLFPLIEMDGIRMLEIRDLAPMKLNAVTGRGTKKDFYDIYFLLKIMPVTEIIDLFRKKFSQHEVFHVIKSLSYFEDAEGYADPVVFDKNLSWETVKSTIQKAVKSLTP